MIGKGSSLAKPVTTATVASTELTFDISNMAPAQPVMAAAPVQQEQPKPENQAFDDLFGADAQPPAQAQPVAAAASSDPFDFGDANEVNHAVPM